MSRTTKALCAEIADLVRGGSHDRASVILANWRTRLESDVRGIEESIRVWDRRTKRMIMFLNAAERITRNTENPRSPDRLLSHLDDALNSVSRADAERDRLQAAIEELLRS